MWQVSLQGSPTIATVNWKILGHAAPLIPLSL